MDSGFNSEESEPFDSVFQTLKNSISAGDVSRIFEISGDAAIDSRRLVLVVANGCEGKCKDSIREILIGASRVTTGPITEEIEKSSMASR